MHIASAHAVTKPWGEKNKRRAEQGGSRLGDHRSGGLSNARQAPSGVGRETQINESVRLVEGSFKKRKKKKKDVQRCVFPVCAMWKRERRESRVVRTPQRMTTSQQQRESGRGRGHGQASAGTDHSTVTHLAVPTDVAGRGPKKKEGERRAASAVPSASPQTTHATPQVQQSSCPRQENATVRHGRSECGLVEAAPVSGRGNAFNQSCQS